mmetsp:Transcript_40676/g.74400  ORF Transcript_40676/g.74400 Transcript_40676/m.74400 type:complete len:151 (+) Transcript_40676:91-543(+)
MQLAHLLVLMIVAMFLGEEGVAAFVSATNFLKYICLPDSRYFMVQTHPFLAFSNQYFTLAPHGSSAISELPSSSSINSKHAQISSQSSHAEKKHQNVRIEANHVSKDISHQLPKSEKRVMMNAKIGMPRYITKASQSVVTIPIPKLRRKG